MPELKTLPADIYSILEPERDHEVSEENLSAFTATLATVLRERLRANTRPSGGLRCSNLGRPDRQLWHEARSDSGSKEKLTGRTLLKFLYGDVIEALLLFLAREAGHVVEHEQREIEIDGVKGHIDAIIDGVVVDVKSASPYGYKKFKLKEIFQDDPFAYIQQLSSYAHELTPGEDAAWLAQEKVSGDICVTELPARVIRHYPARERIAHLRKVIERDIPPPLCYSPVPDGKSGNIKLDTGCSYCPWKLKCFPDVRCFVYSNGPRYLTNVARLPDVPEIPMTVAEAEIVDVGLPDES